MARKRYGKETHPLYVTWHNMVRRCTNPYPKDVLYKQRGITVCDRWLDFDKFVTDMGNKPLGTSLDRIDNDKGYSPDNCRWATPRQQSLNTRRSTDKHNVYYMKHRDRWYVQIMVNRTVHHGGTYKTLAEATDARDKLEEKLFNGLSSNYINP